MDLIVAFLIGIVLFLLATHLAVQHALSPTVPVKGTTNIPGPGWTLPIIGDAWRFAGIDNMTELNKVVQKLLSRTDKAVRMWMGPKLMVLVTDPKIGEAIMLSPKATNKDPDVYHGFNQFSDGVFSRNGKGWRELRRPLNKILRPDNVMDNYFDTFVAKAEELRKSLNNMCNKGTFNILPFHQDCMIDIVFETLMGVPGESKLPERFPLKVLYRLVVICMQLAINPIYKFPIVKRITGLTKDMKMIQSHLHAMGKRLFKSRRKFWEANFINTYEPDYEPDNFTDLTLQLTKKEEEIQKEDDFFRKMSKPYDLIVAGYGTSAISLSSAALFLAMHPEYQEKAYEEQFAIMGDTLRPPTQEEIWKMDYLWMVYQEVIRHVGVPGFFRKISAELEVDGFIFPEGAAVYISLQYFNKCPKYWVKSKEFYPDNFLPENVAKRPKSAWMPFSAGARVCPGITFSRAVGMTVLSTLIRNFKFSTTLKYEEMEYEYLIMLESIKGYPVSVERRPNCAA